MFIFYIDLFTALCFLAFIAFLERRGIIGDGLKYSAPLIQQFNLLIYRNKRLYVFAYFYAITLLNDLETVYRLKPSPEHFVYFLVALLLQVLIALRLQKRSLATFYRELKVVLEKLQLKYFSTPTKSATDAAKEKLLQAKASTHFTFQEIRFLLNSCTLPVLFILSNAYFLAKLFSYFLTHK